jgi:hypothetical protein
MSAAEIQEEPEPVVILDPDQEELGKFRLIFIVLIVKNNFN